MTRNGRFLFDYDNRGVVLIYDERVLRYIFFIGTRTTRMGRTNTAFYVLRCA